MGSEIIPRPSLELMFYKKQETTINNSVMKDNRRDFLRKSASLAAAVSISGINYAMDDQEVKKEKPGKTRPFVKDAGIKFAFLMGPTSPKVPYARQLGVL